MEKVGEFFVGRPSGAVLMAGAGRVYVVEPDGSARWIQEDCGHVHKCALAPDGSLYFANGETFRVAHPGAGEKPELIRTNPEDPINTGFGFAIAADGSVTYFDNQYRRIVDGDVNIATDSSRSDRSAVTNRHHYHRLGRKTDAGTYLITCSGAGMVREYAADGRLLWEQYSPGFIFDTVRLANGNTVVSGLSHVVEYTPDHKVAWELVPDDLTAIRAANLSGLQALPNGNLVIGTFENGASKDGPKASAFEITRDKEIVWAFAASDLNTLTADILV